MSERDIFTYQAADGQELHADPLDIRLKLTTALGNGALQVFADSRNKAEPATAAQARLTIIAAARQAFELPAVDPLSGMGVPAARVEEAVRAFLFFSGGSSEPTAPPPTCSPPAPPGNWPDPAALPEAITSTP